MFSYSLKPNRYSISFLITIFVFISIKLSAQDLPPLPIMWVGDYNSNAEKNWLTSGHLVSGGPAKEDILKAAIGSTHLPSRFFPVKTFDSLFAMIRRENPKLDSNRGGIRVYICAYNSNCVLPGTLPQTSDILFVFAPAEALKSMDLGTYYVIWTDNNVYRIDSTCFRKWVDEYLSHEMYSPSGLASTIELNQEENRMPKIKESDPSYYCDTRGIFYPYIALNEFFYTERCYQDTNYYNNPARLKINGFYITLASYTADGIGINCYGNAFDRFKSRMILQIDYSRDINSQNQIFSIEQTRDFGFRPLPECYSSKKTNAKKFAISGDNGQLCPPNCPCPSPPCR